MIEDGGELIYNLKNVLDNYNLSSKIIAASIRTNKHLEDSALAGAHISTIPGSLFEKMWTHPLTTQGIDNFKKIGKLLFLRINKKLDSAFVSFKDILFAGIF